MKFGEEIEQEKGGEPTLREDLIEIISYASLFMSVAIDTNGILLDKNYAKKLTDVGTCQVKVSLDGAKAITNDANRGKGTYEEAKEKLENPFCSDIHVGYTAGLFSYGIKADGAVMPSPCLRKEIGNLKNEMLRDIWKNSETLKILRDRDRLKGKCMKCVYRFVCGGCRGRTYHIQNDFMAKDPLCWVEV